MARRGSGVTDRRWLDRARRIADLAQTGLTYGTGKFDRERYAELQRIAAEMMGDCWDAPPDRILQLLRRDSGYATPKVDVRGVVFRGDHILLVREIEDGRWTLPGGWADAGLTPSEAVEKEIREESGYEARAAKLLAVHERDRHGAPPLPWRVYKLFIRCEVTGGTPRASMETDAVDFFAADRLPELSQGRVNRSQLERMFEHLRDPELPTDLD